MFYLIFAFCFRCWGQRLWRHRLNMVQNALQELDFFRIKNPYRRNEQRPSLATAVSGKVGLAHRQTQTYQSVHIIFLLIFLLNILVQLLWMP
mmetsp:Transcript_45003/g.67770  ORF Transcript_45003/g.67770 Transcript_45003/m.67770 type:complete len:92 (-) Transcript_45003:42-317(-)